MNSKKNLLIIIICLSLICLILGVVILINKPKKMGDNEEIVDSNVNPINEYELTAANYAIKCINKFQNYVQKENVEGLKKILDEKYLAEIEENIIDELQIYKNKMEFEIEKVYISNINTLVSDYYIYSNNNEEKHYSFILSVNAENDAYKILPCGYIKLEELLQMKSNIATIEKEEAYINLNDDNKMNF